MNFLELVKARYSARKYANRPVEAEKLDYIMECVRFAQRCSTAIAISISA